MYPMLRSSTLFVLFLLLFGGSLRGQKEETAQVLSSYEPDGMLVDTELKALGAGLWSGDTSVISLAVKLLADDRSYREMGLGLDVYPVWRYARRLVGQRMNLTGIGDWWTLSGDELIAYLKYPAVELRYSPLINQFTDLPFTERTVEYRIRSRERSSEDVTIAQLEEAIEKTTREGDKLKFEPLKPYKDPAVLLALAATPSSYYGATFKSEKWLHGLIDVRIEVRNKQGDFVRTFAGGHHELLTYWANNYDQYEWSEAEGRFRYLGSDKLSGGPVTMLVSDLKGDRGDRAFRAVELLTDLSESDYTAYEKLHQQYEFTFKPRGPVGYRYFKPIPLSKQLRVLAELKRYCRERKFPVKADSKLVNWLPVIERAGAEAAGVIDSLGISELTTFENITGLEMQIILQRKQYPMAAIYLSRMLYIWYEVHWEELLAQPPLLGLYLKKHELYAQTRLRDKWFGGFQKFIGADDRSLAALIKMLETETDEVVRKQALQIPLREEVRRTQPISVADFLKYAEQGYIASSSWVEVDTSSVEDAKMLIEGLADTTYRGHYTLHRMIKKQLNKNMAPYLLKFADDTRVLDRFIETNHDFDGQQLTHTYEVLVGDVMVGFLKQLYPNRARSLRIQLTDEERLIYRKFPVYHPPFGNYLGSHRAAEAWRDQF
jgi:hypothetical protein